MLRPHALSDMLCKPCILTIVHCTVRCTVFNVRCVVYRMIGPICSVPYESTDMNCVPYVLFIVFRCLVWRMYFLMCSVYRPMRDVHRKFYTCWCAVCTVFTFRCALCTECTFRCVVYCLYSLMCYMCRM